MIDNSIIIVIIIIGVNVRLEENSIVGDSKVTKESTVPVRRRKRETWDPWWLVVTRSQGL